MNSTQIIGIVAGVLTSISMLPQLIKILKEKSAEDISLLTFTVLVLGLGLWVIYGIKREDWPLIIFNSFSCILNLLIIFFRLRFNGINTNGKTKSQMTVNGVR